jgi:hypothetical protein
VAFDEEATNRGLFFRGIVDLLCYINGRNHRVRDGNRQWAIVVPLKTAINSGSNNLFVVVRAGSGKVHLKNRKSPE